MQPTICGTPGTKVDPYSFSYLRSISVHSYERQEIEGGLTPVTIAV